MMVCLCNRINDGRVRAAIKAGAKKPADVFKILGVPLTCGQCRDTIEAIMNEETRTVSADE